MLGCSFENGNKASLRHVVVDNLVLQGDKILLVKRASRLLAGGKWALVGGFVDRDETIVGAVNREILEETGYVVGGVTLMRIIDRPDRPGEDRQNISFVHFCEAREKVGEPDDESDEQRWFPLTALPPEEDFAFDHYSDIQMYLAYVRESFALPKMG